MSACSPKSKGLQARQAAQRTTSGRGGEKKREHIQHHLVGGGGLWSPHWRSTLVRRVVCIDAHTHTHTRIYIPDEDGMWNVLAHGNVQVVNVNRSSICTHVDYVLLYGGIARRLDSGLSLTTESKSTSILIWIRTKGKNLRKKST